MILMTGTSSHEPLYAIVYCGGHTAAEAPCPCAGTGSYTIRIR